MEQEFTPNSHKYRAEQAAKSEEKEKKKVNKVIQGTAVKKKKSGFSTFISSFIPEKPADVKTYLINDVLVPTVKDAIVETVKMLVNGGKPMKRDRLNVDKVSYRSFFRPAYDEPSKSKESPARLAYSYDDIILGSRQDAEEVLSHMSDLIDEYDMVSVGDLFDMVGISSDYTDQKYGWTNIGSAKVERTRDGYRLDLPKARPLN